MQRDTTIIASHHVFFCILSCCELFLVWVFLFCVYIIVGLSVGAAWIAGQDRSMWRTLRPSAGQAQQWVSELHYYYMYSVYHGKLNTMLCDMRMRFHRLKPTVSCRYLPSSLVTVWCLISLTSKPQNDTNKCLLALQNRQPHRIMKFVHWPLMYGSLYQM